MTLQHKKTVFKQNIRCLVGWLNMNYREIAEGSGIGEKGYRWLRRSAVVGIHGPAANNKDHLKKLARFFEKKGLFKDPRELWNPNLSKQIVGRDLVKSSDLGRELSNEQTVAMFEQLLSVDGYGYLKALVHDLHSQYRIAWEEEHEEEFVAPRRPR